MLGRNCVGRCASGYTRLHLGDFVAARALLERCHGLADPAHRGMVREWPKIPTL